MWGQKAPSKHENGGKKRPQNHKVGAESAPAQIRAEKSVGAKSAVKMQKWGQKAPSKQQSDGKKAPPHIIYKVQALLPRRKIM